MAPLMQSPPGPETVIDGRTYLYFAGTGYLGLQGRTEVIAAACVAARRYGMGSATTRAWFGNMPPTLEVEQEAARFFAADAAFYFASGYWGAQLMVDALADQFEQVFVDALAHYSVVDAARRSGRAAIAFAHADPDDLRAKLHANLAPGARPLVVSDGLFSVRGTIAPAAAYDRLLAEYPGAVLLLDDAHGAGVLGDDGWGAYQYEGLHQRGLNRDLLEALDRPPRLLVSTTLSKALGGFGGLIAGSVALIEQLRTRSPVFSGASPPPPAAAAGAARALQLARSEPELRRRLWANVARLKTGLRGLGLTVADTPAPIVFLAFDTHAAAQRIQAALAEQGILIALASGYSGVGASGALRIAVFSNHTDAMIDRLLRSLAELL